jgi:hypothetical protein
MADAPSTEWPPEVQAKLGRIAELSVSIDEHSTALDAAYEERMDLFLDLRAGDPPVPYAEIGAATGTKEAAVRIGIAKELRRCEHKAAETVGPEQDLGRRGRSDARITLAQEVRRREREAREAAGNGAAARRPRRT